MADNTNNDILNHVIINTESESIIVDDPKEKKSSTVDYDVVSENDMSINFEKISRTKKQIASIKRIAGDPYMGTGVKNGKYVQSFPKSGRYLKDRCVHNKQKNEVGVKGYCCLVKKTVEQFLENFGN